MFGWGLGSWFFISTYGFYNGCFEIFFFFFDELDIYVLPSCPRHVNATVRKLNNFTRIIMEMWNDSFA